MILRKALLERFIKGSNYCHHVRHACPQQFAVVEGFLNIQSLLWPKVKPGQGYLLDYVFTRKISEAGYGMHVLEKVAGRNQIVNS